MEHLYLTAIGYFLFYIQHTSNCILLLCPQHKGYTSRSSALFLTACEHMFPSRKRCGHFLYLSHLVQSTLSTVTQVIWNLSENTENDMFFRSLKSVLIVNHSRMILRMKFESGVGNLWWSQLLIKFCVLFHMNSTEYPLARCYVHSSCLDYESMLF